MPLNCPRAPGFTSPPLAFLAKCRKATVSLLAEKPQSHVSLLAWLVMYIPACTEWPWKAIFRQSFGMI